MTLQTYDELYDDAQRLNPEVVEAMRQWAEDHPDFPWRVEYEIPAETNEWVYMGNPGALSTTHQWVDRYPDPTEAVVVHITPTHPRDKSRDKCEASYLPSFERVTRDNHEVFFTVEGEPYRTPLHVSRRMFWQAVEAAIDWMEENPPG